MSDLNDPRVFFAAERTLTARNRTGLTPMAFGFVLERLGLFLHVLRQDPGHVGRDLFSPCHGHHDGHDHASSSGTAR